MTETVYLNGQYLAKEAAHISPFDRGFLFGDAIYEVTPIYDQAPFRIKAHFQRLQRNTAQIGIQLPISFSDFEAIVNTLLQQPNRPEACACSDALGLLGGCWGPRGAHFATLGCSGVALASS